MILLFALLCLALMTGNELCIAVFIHPLLRALPERKQTPFLSRVASRLGAVMPFWYASSLALTFAAAWLLHRSGAGWNNTASWSALVQAAVVLFTVTMLVPINNQLAKLREDETGWTPQANKWDRMHRLRVLLLLVALGLLFFAVVTRS